MPYMGLTNVYTKFKALTTTDLRVGQVVSVDTTNGVTHLQDFNGLDFTALGTSVSAGNNAYVKDGIVQGTAPSIALSADALV